MAPSAPVDAAGLVAAHIRRHGPMRFDLVMDLALYHPEAGYFAVSTEAGRRGDFITSPEVGPLFGAVIANALDGWWHDLGEPDPFVVVEAGAGRGALAIAVLRAAPACLGALTYVLVERSAGLRARHGDHLPIESPSHALLPAVDDDDPPTARGRGSGPRVVSLPDLPVVPVTGVVLANELIDNLPCRIVRRTATGWEELHAVLSDADDGAADGLMELFVPCVEESASALSAAFPDVVAGEEIPVHDHARRWLGLALDLVERGAVVVIDYGAATTAEIGRRADRGWLRTFRGHGPGSGPLEAMGRQDITVDVGFDQVVSAGAAGSPPVSVTTQATFLSHHGIDALVEDGRRIWQERGHLGDLAAVAGRSRIREAEALLDASGLGAFLVAEWHRP